MDTIEEFEPYIEKFLDDINIGKGYIRGPNRIDIICDKLKKKHGKLFQTNNLDNLFSIISQVKVFFIIMKMIKPSKH